MFNFRHLRGNYNNKLIRNSLLIFTIIPVALSISKVCSNSSRNFNNASSAAAITPSPSLLLSNPSKNKIESILVKPGSIRSNIINNPDLKWRKEIYELPLTNKIIENPFKHLNIIEEAPSSSVEKIVDLPAINDKQDENDVGKQAARLIVIRRRKMKKHKLRKLRKRMKFAWAKVRTDLKNLSPLTYHV